MIKVIGLKLVDTNSGNYSIVGAKTDTLDTNCFNTRLDIVPCFTTTLEDNNNCFDFTNEPTPITPPNRKKELPYKVYTIDYKFANNTLYMIVEEDSNSNNEVIDYFAHINSQNEDETEFYYIPPYKFDEIVDVKDKNGVAIDYDVAIDSNGIKYLKFSNYIRGLFDVTYKPTIKSKIIEANFFITNNINNPIELSIIREKDIPKELIGNNCILMSHQEADNTIPLLFRDNNNRAWRINIFDLSMERIEFDTPSYMASAKYAYNDNSFGAYDIVNKVGYKTFFEPKLYNRDLQNRYYNLKYFMQGVDDNATIAISTDYNNIYIFPRLRFKLFRVDYVTRKWSGVGATGYTLFMGKDKVVEEAEFIPNRPSLENPLIIDGKVYNCDYMQTDSPDYLYIKHPLSSATIPSNTKPISSKKRITINNTHYIMFDNNILYRFKMVHSSYNLYSTSCFYCKYWGVLDSVATIDSNTDFTVLNDNKTVLTVNGSKDIKLFFKN